VTVLGAGRRLPRGCRPAADRAAPRRRPHARRDRPPPRSPSPMPPAPRTAARPGGARAVSADPPGDRARPGPRPSVRGALSESCSHHGVPRSPRPCLAAPTRARAAASAASSSVRFAVRTAERAVPRWCSNRARTGSGSSGSAARHRLPPTTIHRPSGVRGAGTHASCQAVPCCAGVPRANLDILCPGSTLSRCG
jgi:hypothetical protein